MILAQASKQASKPLTHLLIPCASRAREAVSIEFPQVPPPAAPFIRSRLFFAPCFLRSPSVPLCAERTGFVFTFTFLN
jgi:hypothetical protein